MSSLFPDTTWLGRFLRRHTVRFASLVLIGVIGPLRSKGSLRNPFLRTQHVGRGTVSRFAGPLMDVRTSRSDGPPIGGYAVEDTLLAYRGTGRWILR